MNKSYLEMTASERIADRIAKNRKSELSARGGRGLSLDTIIAKLDARKQRATYAAVAGLVGVLPRGLMAGRAKSYAASWVVAATTSGASKRGWPTGYTVNQIHPECYRQICEGQNNIIDDGEALKHWLKTT